MRLHIQLPAKAGWLRISNCEAEEVLSWPDEVFQEFLKSPNAGSSERQEQLLRRRRQSGLLWHPGSERGAERRRLCL